MDRGRKGALARPVRAWQHLPLAGRRRVRETLGDPADALAKATAARRAGAGRVWWSAVADLAVEQCRVAAGGRGEAADRRLAALERRFGRLGAASLQARCQVLRAALVDNLASLPTAEFTDNRWAHEAAASSMTAADARRYAWPVVL